MASRPGQPHDATLHPRTRPEANEFALKNRQTNDWFRHDGENVEVVPKPVPRLSSKQARDIANKHQNLAEPWFEHNPASALVNKINHVRCTTAESQAIHDKVYGRDENWFKHEDNMDFYQSRKDRLSSTQAADIKQSFTEANNQTMDWYKHQAVTGKTFVEIKPRTRTGAVPLTKELAEKMQGSADILNWQTEHTALNEGKHRVTCQEAEDYVWRNQNGSSSQWYSPDNDLAPATQTGPRVVSKEGEEIASRIGKESVNWYDHDANRQSPDPRPASRYMSAEVKQVKEKSSGTEMKNLLLMASTAPRRPDVARPSVLMNNIMNQDDNLHYTSPRPCPRVKPEATEAFEKNKGCMNDFMQGYLPAPYQHSGPRIRPEAKGNAKKHSGSSMDKVIKGQLPDSGRGHAGRVVKPEAAENARKNMGTLNSTFTGLPVEDDRVPRLRSELAMEIAEKNKGCVADLLYIQA